MVVSALVCFAPLASAETDRDGAALFTQHCQSCHAVPQEFDGPRAAHEAEFLLRMRVRVGMGSMPAFPARTLPDHELIELVDYVLQQPMSPYE